MRDRLIELLENATGTQYYGDEIVKTEMDIDEDDIKRIADHLLANGVIVPPYKVGDKVYVLAERYRMPKGIYEGNVKNLIVTGEKNFITTKLWNGAEITTPASEVFCDKEAEQALKGVENK